MYKCTNCNYSTDEVANFCPQCGTQLVEEKPVCEAPVEQVTYIQPEAVQQVQYYPMPEPVKKPSLAKKIVGMALSIESFAVSIFALLYTIMFTAIEGVAGFAMAITFAICDLPPAIIGLVMSLGCINLGDRSVMSRLGKIFGIIAIALTALTLLIGFVSLFSGHSVFNDPYYYL